MSDPRPTCGGARFTALRSGENVAVSTEEQLAHLDNLERGALQWPGNAQMLAAIAELRNELVAQLEPGEAPDAGAPVM